jgi:periplasmic protein TonB
VHRSKKRELKRKVATDFAENLFKSGPRRADGALVVICTSMKNLSRILFLIAAFAVPAFAQKSEPPVPVRTVAPEYPQELRRDGVSGLVMVKCTIDEQGNVVDPQVEKSSNAAFEKPAVEALKKWKFKPAKQDGAVVSIKVSIPIKFVFES